MERLQRMKDLEGNKMIETIVKVEGMMCGMCESHVNEAVRKAFPARCARRVATPQ